MLNVLYQVQYLFTEWINVNESVIMITNHSWSKQVDKFFRLIVFERYGFEELSQRYMNMILKTILYSLIIDTRIIRCLNLKLVEGFL